MLRKRVTEFEGFMKELLDTVKTVEHNQEVMKVENEVLRKDCDDLRRKICTNEQKMEVNEVKVKELNENQNQWKKDCEQEQVDFKKIMKDTVREKEQNVAKITFFHLSVPPSLGINLQCESATSSHQNKPSPLRNRDAPLGPVPVQPPFPNSYLASDS